MASPSHSLGIDALRRIVVEVESARLRAELEGGEDDSDSVIAGLRAQLAEQHSRLRTLEPLAARAEAAEAEAEALRAQLQVLAQAKPQQGGGGARWGRGVLCSRLSPVAPPWTGEAAAGGRQGGRRRRQAGWQGATPLGHAPLLQQRHRRPANNSARRAAAARCAAAHVAAAAGALRGRRGGSADGGERRV